jgi:hypothetical protein
MGTALIRQPHKTIRDVLNEESEIELQTALATTSPEQAVEFLRKAFDCSLRLRDGKRSTRIVGYLLHAIEDVELHPVMNIDGSWNFYADDKEGTKRIKTQQGLARTKRAREALRTIEAFVNVPSETALFLFREAAEWCYLTPDEIDADSLFELLTKTFRDIANHGGGPNLKDLCDVLKGVTNEEVSRERLARHFLVLKRMATNECYQELDHNSDLSFIGRVLAAALARKNTLEETARGLMLTEQLNGCTESIFLFLVKNVIPVARKLDEAGLDLERMFLNSPTAALSEVITVGYASLSEISVIVATKERMSTTVLVERSDALRAQIKEWQKGHRFMIHLTICDATGILLTRTLKA